MALSNRNWPKCKNCLSLGLRERVKMAKSALQKAQDEAWENWESIKRLKAENAVQSLRKSRVARKSMQRRGELRIRTR